MMPICQSIAPVKQSNATRYLKSMKQILTSKFIFLAAVLSCKLWTNLQITLIRASLCQTWIWRLYTILSEHVAYLKTWYCPEATDRLCVNLAYHMLVARWLSCWELAQCHPSLIVHLRVLFKTYSHVNLIQIWLWNYCSYIQAVNISP